MEWHWRLEDVMRTCLDLGLLRLVDDELLQLLLVAVGELGKVEVAEGVHGAWSRLLQFE